MAAELCVALDGSDRDWILKMAEELSSSVDWLKIGLEAFTAFGPELLDELSTIGPRLFLDLKLHDIPNTVAGAVSNAAGGPVGLLNVHAAGGRAMMRAAKRSLMTEGLEGRTRLIAVTLLTSLDEAELSALGFASAAEDLVRSRALLALECGLDGVVASPREISAVRETCGPDFLIVTPGIRPAWASTDDQKRVLTPAEAVSRGADILVVGRPITRAKNPHDAAMKILQEMKL